MADYEVGKAFLTVVPSFKGIERALAAEAGKIGKNLEKIPENALPEGFAKGLKEAVRQSRRHAADAGDEVGDQFSGHFATTLRRRLQAAFKALPELEITSDSTKVERGLAKLRDDFAELADQKIGVDIDDATAVKAVNRFRARLVKLESDAKAARLKVDLSAAQDEVDAWATMVAAGGERAAREAEQAAQKAIREAERAARETAQAARRAAEKATREAERAARETAQAAKRAAQDAAREAEEAFGATWAGRVRRHIESAIRALPDLKLPADPSEAQLAIRRIRDDLQSLRGQTIGVDIDTADAVQRITTLRAQLVDLAKADPSVQVQADTVAAAGQLVAIEQLAQRLDNKDVDIHVGTDGDSAGDAMRRLGEVTGVSLSRLESLVLVSLSLGTVLVPAAAAAAAAVGFIATAAGAATASIGVMVLGFGGIGEAVKALDNASDEANESSASLARSQLQVAGATDAIRSAERGLANARANNADAARRAAHAVSDAERGVARAQEEARQATLDLIRAREEERRANQDLAFDLEGLAIAQRQANIDQIEAKKELDEILANPRATEEQREQARITYDQISLRIRELGVQQERLTAQQQRNARVGVEGSERVQAAHRRVQDTTEGVALAQRRLSEAILAQQAQQRQAASALAAAQQAVAAAHRQSEQAAVRAGVAGGDALDRLNEAMSRLSPAGQRFAQFVFGLKDEFLELRAVASDNLLPGVQAAIEGALPFLPEFTAWVGRVAGAIGAMFAETTRFLSTDSTWRRFFGFIGQETVPTLERLYRVGRNVSTGLAGLIVALSPFNDDIGSGLADLTQRFADWATTLEHNQGFQKFLEFVRENGPKVVGLIGELTEFVGRFIIAAAPVGVVVTEAFIRLFDALNQIPLNVLTLLVAGLATLAATLLLLSAVTRGWALASAVIKNVGLLWEGLQKVQGAAMQRYQAAMAEATVKTGQFGGALTNINAAASVARSGLSRVVSFLGGPWAIALFLAGAALNKFIQDAAEHKARVDSLADALGGLSEAYRDLREGSREGLDALVRQNRGLQELITNTRRYGISLEQIVAAIEGDVASRDVLVRAYDDEITRLGDLIGAYKEQQTWLGRNEDAQRLLTEAGFNSGKEVADRINVLRSERDGLLQAIDANAKAEQAVGLLGAAERTTATAADRASRGQRDLVESLAVLADAAATAAEKASALRRAQDELTGAAKNANEANEDYERSVDDLTASIQRNGATLDVNTEAGRANRDAIQDRLEASLDLLEADIAAGKPIADAIRLHEDRTAALREETDQAGLAGDKVQELIDIYGKVPPAISTQLSTVGFDKVLKDMDVLQVVQFALRENLTFDQALAKLKDRLAFARQHAMATGGFITGPGTKTSDDIPIWASDGEFMQQAAAVDYYGVPFMQAINERKIPKGLLPGFATGGLVTFPFPVDVSRTFVMTRDEALEIALRGLRGTGGIGSARMMQILRSQFPGLALFSGYRPGSRTRSGNLSYHAMRAADGSPGRAVDVPPRMDVFQWIRGNYPDSRELIFSPAGGQQIWNGRPHLFTGAVVADHFDHVHWAYDDGGFLPPGFSTVFNGTGKPEPVLTDAQWRQLSAATRGGDGPREVHHWHFRDQDLDLDRLQAWQDRRDAMARLGRAR